MTARRLLTLVEHLPEVCAFRVALAGDDAAWLGFDRVLLGIAIDELRGIQYQDARIAGVKDIKPPEPIHRRRTTRKPSDPGQASRAIERLEARTGRRIPDDVKAVMVRG